MFNKNVRVWVNGGDSSHPMMAKKGSRVWLSGGHSYIVGEKYGSHIDTYYTAKDMSFMICIYGRLVNSHQFRKLDLKTRYELFKNGISISSSVPCSLDDYYSENTVHVYDNFEQYEKVLKYYVPNITDEMLYTGILFRTKDNQIVSMDKTCFDLISIIKETKNYSEVKNDAKVDIGGKNSKEEQGPVKKLVPSKK
jgi:hypothetical protein